MRRVHADAGLREAQQALLLRVAQAERLERAEDDGVVGDDHGAVCGEGFVDDGAREVDGEEDGVGGGWGRGRGGREEGRFEEDWMWSWLGFIDRNCRCSYMAVEGWRWSD